MILFEPLVVKYAMLFAISFAIYGSLHGLYITTIHQTAAVVLFVFLISDFFVLPHSTNRVTVIFDFILSALGIFLRSFLYWFLLANGFIIFTFKNDLIHKKTIKMLPKNGFLTTLNNKGIYFFDIKNKKRPFSRSFFYIVGCITPGDVLIISFI